MPEGTHQLRVEFDYDGGGVSKGGTATLFVDGDQVGQGRVEHTAGIMFASDETTSIGADTATVVTDANGPAGQNGFTGDISWIRLDTGDDPRPTAGRLNGDHAQRPASTQAGRSVARRRSPVERCLRGRLRGRPAWTVKLDESRGRRRGQTDDCGW